jgi:hypothetical protein
VEKRLFEGAPPAACVDRLEEILRERLHLEDVVALADVAERVATTFAPAEDPPREEAAERFYTPRFYDAFALAVLGSDLPAEAQTRVADLAFDLVQLPGTEREAFVTTEIVPQHLPLFASHLVREGRATAQHLLALIYALFHRALEPERLLEFPPADAVAVAGVPDADDRARALYAILLCTYPRLPDREALAWFRAFAGPGGLDAVSRERLAATLKSRPAFQAAFPSVVGDNDLGSVDFDVWPYSLPLDLQRAARAWAPL